MPSSNGVELRSLFLGLQRQMIAKLTTNRENIVHPGSKGDATELCWKEMLNTYLPIRYQVDKAFVLDADGKMSEQLDIVIFDQQYSPFLFNQGGTCYIPAESVYAVFEVRQDLSKEEVEYAASKAASVRCLRRTSAPIPYAAGKYAPRSLFHILAGVLTLGSTWSPPFGSSFRSTIEHLPLQRRIDLGCALQSGAFDVRYDNRSIDMQNHWEQNSVENKTSPQSINHKLL